MVFDAVITPENKRSHKTKHLFGFFGKHIFAINLRIQTEKPFDLFSGKFQDKLVQFLSFAVIIIYFFGRQFFSL